MAFDIRDHVRKVQGGAEYVDVKWLVVAFRERFGNDGIIVTGIIEHDPEKKFAVFKATVGYHYGDGKEYRVLATAHNMETFQGFKDYLTKAETSAVGRALRMAGFGIEMAGYEFEEGERLADAPVDKPAASAGNGHTDPATPQQLDEDTPQFRKDRLSFRELLKEYKGWQTVTADQQFRAYITILGLKGEAANSPITHEGIKKCIDRLDTLIKEKEAKAASGG